MSRLRRFLLGFHLVAGLSCSAVLLITAATGAALALERPVLDHLARDVARVTPEGTPKSLAECLDAVALEYPDAKAGTITVSADPARAVELGVGRGERYFFNPYTAAVSTPEDAGARDFFKLMLTWHRWLGVPESARGEDGERTGIDWRGHAATVVGVASIGLVLLSLSGLILWFPRHLTRAAWRFAAVPRLAKPGHAAYGNWHRVIGWWMLPAVLLTAVTGAAMGFHAIGDALAKRPDPAETARIEAFDTRAERASPDALLGALRARFPAASAYTLRLGPPGGGRVRRQSGAKPVPQGVTATVHEPGALLDTTVVLHPLTADIVRVTRATDHPPGLTARLLLKPLHTGARGGALGVVVALVSALAVLGLTLTGLALAWRRFRPKKHSAP